MKPEGSLTINIAWIGHSTSINKQRSSANMSKDISPEDKRASVTFTSLSHSLTCNKGKPDAHGKSSIGGTRKEQHQMMRSTNIFEHDQF